MNREIFYILSKLGYYRYFIFLQNFIQNLIKIEKGKVKLIILFYFLFVPVIKLYFYLKIILPKFLYFQTN